LTVPVIRRDPQILEERRLYGMRILIVDDEPANVLLLKSILKRAGYTNVHGDTDPMAVSGLVTANEPDLIILDLHMPNHDGFEVLADLRQLHGVDDYYPVFVVTADITQDVKRRALNQGATDFLTKPFDSVEVNLRVKNLLRSKALHQQLQISNHGLEQLVQHRTTQLTAAHFEIVTRLAMAAELRDDDTGQHTQRVARLTALIARQLGLDNYFVELIERAAPLHDVGKIGIPDIVLLKPGKLDELEWEIMKSHTIIGRKLLTGTESPILNLAEEIAATHHERWDGTGYPLGISGEDIPVAARITAVADVFDALTHQRPYKPAWPLDTALEEIENQRGQHFAPDVVDSFLKVLDDEDLLSDELFSNVLSADDANV
jgi:response regulator RpfG family c-di-GMP phosphodiesterase